MTDDVTEMQTDRVNACGIPQGDGPARKWFYQRLIACASFACICWTPVLLAYAPMFEKMLTEWFLFHGSVVAGWFGITKLTSLNR